MEGTFNKCTNCNVKNNCCCDFEKIDNPIISLEEKRLIENYTDKNIFKHIDGNCFNIESVNGTCPFYDGKCTIYNIRPNDCKLYPYDIKMLNNKYYLIRYCLGCIDDNEELEDVDTIVDKIKPYIRIFTDKKYNKKFKKIDYIIIKEIET